MMSEQEVAGFFADRSELALEDYVRLTYLFQTEGDPRLAAASLCREQSTAQWQRPGHPEDLRGCHGAKVIALERLGERRYQVELAHPHINFGPRLPNFLTVAAGEGPFYCPGITTIRWIDFAFPPTLLQQFAGPQFGLAGLRALTGIYGRPLFLGVVKPNLGLAPADFAETAYQAWCGGLDVAKDDEMLDDPPWSPLALRVRLTSQARRRAEEATGEKKFYIANITTEVDRLEELYHQAVDNGACGVMLNPIMIGMSAVRLIRKIARVPIMCHFAGTAIFSRIPDFGISSLVTTKLQRLSGADIIGLAGLSERMGTSEEEVKANIKACLEPWGSLAAALPVVGGSLTAASLPLLVQKIGHADFGLVSGRGVFAHPKGPAAGARALIETWRRLAS